MSPSVLVWHQLCFLSQAFMMHCVTKAMPIHFIDGKCHNNLYIIKKLKTYRTGLIGYYACLSHELSLMSWGQGHTHIHMYQLPAQSKLCKPGMCVV